MTTNRILPWLTAKERLSAYLEAGLRGDQDTMQRLTETAPLTDESISHHLLRLRAVWVVAATIRLEQFQLSADLWHTETQLAWLETEEGIGADNAAKQRKIWEATSAVCRWRLALTRDAWLTVAKRLDVPPEFLSDFGECVAFKLAEAELTTTDL